ncbi:MAG TPA: ABC transporter permease [Phycisphaerae bacterium]|nr:ABC transporter permease [Phycisphaerae bacterium]
MTTLDYRSTQQGGGVQGFLWTLAAKREYALALLIVFIVAAVSIKRPSFLAPSNLSDLLVYCTQPAIVSCGVMLVIVTGEIDISVGSMLGLLTAVMGTLVAGKTALVPGFGWPVWAAILATLALGTAIGLINGLLVTLVRVPSIIVTLAMLMILQSITFKIMHRGNITDIPASLQWFGIGDLGSIFGLQANGAPVVPLGKVCIWVMAATLVGTWGLIRFTPLGRRIYAVGSNPHAATLSGVSVARIKLFTFALTGLLVGVATVVTTLGAYDNGIGTGFELLVVTCVVVGGVSISGGVGSVLGVFLGVLLLQIMKPVLIFFGTGANWDKAIQGALILGAVLVDHFASRRQKTGGH